MFFRIERTGPPGGGPARSFLPDPCPHPSHFPARLRVRRLYNPAHHATRQPLRDHLRSSFDPCDTPTRAGHGPAPSRATRSRVPRSQRLRRRRDARHASRRRRLAPITRTDTRASLRLRLPRSLSPSGWNGECIAAYAARRPGEPATDPHTAHGTPCPPLAAFAAKRLRRARLAASGSRPIFGSFAECAFPSPPFRFCSLCSARCLPLPNRLASSRRG